MSLSFHNVESEARDANSAAEWDRLWAQAETRDWRRDALISIYNRIVQLVPDVQQELNPRVVDLGGGVGFLAKRLAEEKGRHVEVWDISPVACDTVNQIPVERGKLYGWTYDLEDAASQPKFSASDVVVCTETLEHLSEGTRDKVLRAAAEAKLAFISVPNGRLDHDEEHQHTISWTALEFKHYLQRYFKHVRVEADQNFLLGICGFEKTFKLSMTMPVRDEAADIERTLISFMGIADEIVIGVDPRTKDATREIARKYADVVFDLEDPQWLNGPEPVKGENKVHFAWIRNQCIAKCTGDWIFMTEGHERLKHGKDMMLELVRHVPSYVEIVMVFRSGQGQRWLYPWLFRNNGKWKFVRSTHNLLDFDFDKDPYVIMPQVVTDHFRDHTRSQQRAEQRRLQNRKTLLDDWVVNNNVNSLFYLAQEWREVDQHKALRYFETYLAQRSGNGPMRYQARLVMAKHYADLMQQAREAKDSAAEKSYYEKARVVLTGALDDDWNRACHWIRLGDLAFERESYHEALQFYLYASTRIGQPPLAFWWFDEANYTYLPAQRLAMCYGALGDVEQALHWARRTRELYPEDAPQAMTKEAEDVITYLEEARNVVT